ncbi:hypothetical protein [Streptomyces goshikiensis]|uniref:hypothetical protein n=1 Tax=Streptomyces goshikiensis TaxID=1942 RepID=UPI0036BE70A0
MSARCRATGTGGTVAFETKATKAMAMARRVITERTPFRWATTDSDYGFSHSAMPSITGSVSVEMVYLETSPP